MNAIEAKIKAELEQAENQVVKGYDEGTYYRVGDLSNAFDRVKDETNWKKAINATLWATVPEINLIRESIIFYAGCIPYRIEVLSHDGEKLLVNIKAVGYYKAVGA